jgi:F-type H+-transporting ATPase subunit b
MSIDWFTVVAQILNFVVLVLLLKRFLYKPILSAIATREKRIADEIADAKEKMAEAEKERNEYQRKNDEFDKARLELLEKAKKDANAERVRLIEEAKTTADDLNAKHTAALKADAKNLSNEITYRAQKEVFAISRKVLADLSTTSLEASLFAEFLRRVRELEDPAKEKFAKAFAAASEPALVRSAFELTAQQREEIQKVLDETFQGGIKLRFQVEAELLGGIELTSNGQKIAWNIANYLKTMGKIVDDAVGEQIDAEFRDERP